MAELTEFVDAETAEAVAVAAGAPIDQDEIGRASCRERVL